MAKRKEDKNVNLVPEKVPKKTQKGLESYFSVIAGKLLVHNCAAKYVKKC